MAYLLFADYTMQQPPTLEPVFVSDPGPYLVTSSIEIKYLLSQLLEKGEIICLYPAGKREPFAISTLLAIDDQGLLFDGSNDSRTNDALTKENRIFLVGVVNKVKIQFELPNAQQVLFDGRTAIRSSGPVQTLRMQRRDFYRLDIPMSQRMDCTIPLANGGHTELSVTDISLGGLSLLGVSPDLPMVVGDTLHNCRIQLLDVGLIEIDMQICIVIDVTLKNGIKTQRVGCRFFDLSGKMQTQIQRFINKIERQRISRE
ncbi:flagellar regulator YcgR PilZN domain-containing protein [Iodobacter sp. CM08]|uniref:flagellar brake protein n=1 Tax=Iodobacter sp. CM08 TaxID=3085902 RepID=UPI0029817E7B|nr:flagellar regulator YcgR PilZN domain-containing protein [Iodobacter sp. CM08]MDW5417224.1 flagellar regulator YcgR PilZN domain-containing protein [Iodobacter sp. CM08]